MTSIRKVFSAVIPLRGLFPEESWRQLALCAQVDVGDLWFPNRGEQWKDDDKRRGFFWDE